MNGGSREIVGWQEWQLCEIAQCDDQGNAILHCRKTCTSWLAATTLPTNLTACTTT